MARLPLVGRAAEVAVLAEALAEVETGDGGALVLLVGEPGIGKSRLCEEVARMAAAARLPVAWGRAWEAGGAPPYWPWIQVLRALDLGEAAIARLGGSHVGAAASSEDRFLVFDGTTRDLGAATATTPAVAILEDLHAADEASLHLLAFLAKHVSRMRLLVVGTYRDVEARMTPAAGAVLERAARDARVIAPRRLARAEVEELVGSALDAETVALLDERSEGNPLFVTQLMRVAARRGAGDALTIPASVRTAIREHLRGLPAALPPVLEVAAVIGREVTTAGVAELAELPGSQVDDVLASAVGLGVLVERAPGRFAFAHGLIAETLHHDLPAARRANLHLALADMLERASASDPSAPLAEIAHHLFEAGPEHATRAADVARRAAEQARAQLAFEPAAALVERALAILPPGNALARFELLRLLGDVRSLAGDGERGREAAREAAAVARALGSAELLARAALTYGGVWSLGYTDQVLLQLSEEALAGLPPGDSQLRARLMARLASALQPAREADPPMAMARAAIAMADRLGDDRTRLEVRYAASAALVLFAPPAECREIDRTALALAERLDEPLIALRSHQRLIFAHAELGDLAGVAVHHRAYDELVARLRLPRATWLSIMVRAMLAMLEGRWADHDAAIAEVEALPAEARHPLYEHATRTGHRVRMLYLHGDRATLAREREVVKHMASWGNRTFTYPEILSGLAARLGELDEARALLTREVVETVRVHKLLMAAAEAAEVIFRLGDPDLAAILYDWVAEEGPRLAMLHSHGFVMDRPAAYMAMQLAATLGDLAAARRHYEVALAMLRSLNARPLEAWLALDFATILARTRDPALRDEATRLLAHARTLATAARLAIDDRIAAVHADLAAPRPADDVRVQMRCEGDHWLVEGLGATCRLKTSRGVEILARLVGEPGRELHALELIGDGDSVIDTGDAGEVLDAEAKAAYKRRLVELQEELAEAEGWNDVVRAERARDEIEALQAELSRAIGLGGRSRRTGRAAERARVNVQRRLADAIRKLAETAPVLGGHLAHAIRTGIYCSYVPERARRG